MRKKFNLNLLLSISIVVFVSTSCLQPSAKSTISNAAQIILNMQAGFNLGNTFDNGINPTDPETIKPIIDLYVDQGMKHIRIPVTWMEGFRGDPLTDSLGNVNFEHSRFLQLKEVVDYALNKGLYVVINAHHEREFKKHYDDSPEYNARFQTLWTGIANYFKNYNQKLIFELLNEPEGAFGRSGGEREPTDSLAIYLTQKVFRVGNEAIRKTGGLNNTRIIMITTNGMGNQEWIEEVYPTKETLPGGGTDSCIAIQVHTYDPWSFCGQNGKNENYPGREAISNSISKVALHAQFLGVPVNYGEYGVGRSDNRKERNTDLVREYYHTLVQTTFEHGMSSTVWDDRGWFGLIEKNKTTDEWQFVYNIVPLMLSK
ncbi:MAG: glycoside hydrolase family 5 protein [Prolixibacteraceae bacterium]|nr:glycoside hydrolase family 5 protein [Prolixibacteraceae bacterium]